MVITRDNNDTAKEFFTAMLQLAGDLGCQLSTTPSNPDVLRGLCPFHDASTLNNANTLQINTRSARFWCIICSAEGNPLAFISRAWGVSARDAHQLLTIDPSPTAERPPYPPDHFQSEDGRPSPQNTALLTKASRHFGKKIYTNYEALHYLANLGIPPRQAELSGIGYATGQGLKDDLVEHGIHEDEILQSPLFSQNVDIEAFAGRITLSDLDFTSATLWITTLMPETPQPGSAWPSEKPIPRGIRGFKPYLFNLYSISQRFPRAILTDDPRLYMVLKTQNIPTSLITQRRRPTLGLADHCGRMAHSLLNRGLTHLIMALHDTEVATALRDTILSIAPATKIGFHTKQAIMANVTPWSRNLEDFTNLDPLPDQPQDPEPRHPGTHAPDNQGPQTQGPPQSDSP